MPKGGVRDIDIDTESGRAIANGGAQPNGAIEALVDIDVGVQLAWLLVLRKEKSADDKMRIGRLLTNDMIEEVHRLKDGVVKGHLLLQVLLQCIQSNSLRIADGHVKLAAAGSASLTTTLHIEINLLRDGLVNLLGAPGQLPVIENPEVAVFGTLFLSCLGPDGVLDDLGAAGIRSDGDLIIMLNGGELCRFKTADTHIVLIDLLWLDTRNAELVHEDRNVLARLVEGRSSRERMLHSLQMVSKKISLGLESGFVTLA
jgi:hypothetical protein